jgi:hypothetical protein
MQKQTNNTRPPPPNTQQPTTKRTRQRVEQERGRLADHVALQEQVGQGVDVAPRGRRRLLGDHLGEAHGARRVVHHQLLQQLHVVEAAARLARERHERRHVALLGERDDHLAARVARLVHLERHVLVAGAAHEVAQLLARLELALVPPVAEQLALVLRQDQARELGRLERVELAAREQGAQVDEHGRLLAGRRRHRLEALDDLLGAQRALRRVGGELGGLLVLAGGEQALKLRRDEALGAGQAAAARHREREVEVVELLRHERHHRGLVDGRQQHLAAAVDGQDAARRVGRGRQKDGVGRDAVAVHGRRRLEVVHEQQAELGDDVHEAEARRHLQADGEVVGKLGREEELGGALDGAAGRAAELDHVQLGHDLAVLERLLRKRDHVGREVAAGELDGRERGRVRLERLALGLLDRVELHDAARERGAVDFECFGWCLVVGCGVV